MMTTSYPHNAGMHPQGLPHGHPMAGPGPNPGQQMPPGMHPGVSGPNGPVNQGGPMMSMPPGMGGPTAHALSHLQPQQQMFAQQQQQQQQHPGMMNPALIQQQNFQRQAMMRQQQQQAMLAQQQGGMPGGFANPMQNMTPQQLAALQARGMQPFGVNLPPHLQLQQQQQQMASQQGGNPQQAAALAQAQAAQQHAQQQQQMQQQQQQQQQQQAQAQAIAMSQAHSQQSNHSQNANQGPPTSQQPQQGPLRPPSAMSVQGQSPAPQPTPQQQPQPPPQQQPQPQPQQQQQQPPQQSGPQPGQQTPAPSQPATLPQQQNQQPQNPAQMQQRNPQMAQQAQAQAQAVHAQAAQVQARNMALMKQAQQAQNATGGQATLKLLNFVDQISRYKADKEPNKIERWQAFVDKFFAETGSFIHCVYHKSSTRTKQFEIVYAALPRYFYTLFNTDVCELQITLDGSIEKANPPELKVTCESAKFIYTYKNKCQVVYPGKLTAFWSGSDKMEWLQFEGADYEQLVPRSALEALFHQPSPNQMNPNQSPRMNKNAKAKQQRAMEPPEPYLPISKLPSAGITDYGLPPPLLSYLEIYETMNNMTGLMAHYLEHPNMNPVEALESWNTMMSATQPQPMGQQNPGQNMGQPGQMQQPNMPSGARPPGQPGQHMFMSPAMQHSLLPNGGMTGSPGMMHTPSPNSHPMVKQQSTSSHTASVNTSPNIQNKRRRSTAKIDGDDGDMNGAKVKQSPRVGGNKRMKAGN